MIFRLLEDGIRESALHFAIEEAILRGVDEGTSLPTLRMRRCEKAVWIGVHQKAREEVDVDFCAREGIPIIRRHNPGGAVYQDSGSLCFSCTFRKDDFFPYLGIQEPEELYPLFGRAVARMGKLYGLTISWAPVNDATIGGKKIFGSAQVLQYSALSHTGSLLVDVDLDAMARVLRPPSIKFIDKSATTVRDRVLNLSDAVGRSLDPSEVSGTLSRCIANELGIQLVPSGLKVSELEAAEGLRDEKYGRPEWTFREENRIGKVVAAKSGDGVVSLDLRMSGSIIDSIGISGDFLAPDGHLLDVVIAGIPGMGLVAAADAVRKSALPAALRMTICDLLEGI